MSDHVVRNPEIIKVDPFREFVRRNCENGWEGFVYEDIDLVWSDSILNKDRDSDIGILRRFGSKFSQDEIGCFRFIETKYSLNDLGAAQKRTFGLIDLLLGWTSSPRYEGFFLIQYNDPAWPDDCTVRVNRTTTLTGVDFIKWLRLNVPPIPGLCFPEVETSYAQLLKQGSLL